MPEGVVLTRLKGDERFKVSQKMKADYEAGNSIRDLVAIYHRSYGLCRNLLLEANVEIRQRGRKNAKV